MTPSDQDRFLRPPIFSPYPQVIAAQSTRNGGFGRAPYASLNLGLYTKDDSKLVAKNRAAFFGDLGFSSDQTAGALQVHETAVLTVQVPGQYQGFDALITQQKDILLTVTVADCTPILIFDPETKAIAAIHAGWRGTVDEIAKKVLGQMTAEFGTQAQNCLAYIGPCIDRNTFEVDQDVAQHFDIPFKDWNSNKKKFYVDLKKANKSQLESIGLLSDKIEISPYSTVTHNQYFFSHRKEKGKTGRMICAIGLKA
ncbi:MAG: peptidoglycan editing factor PgeF [Saprospiraceae bacterium]